jgi:hypothetical protein
MIAPKTRAVTKSGGADPSVIEQSTDGGAEIRNGKEGKRPSTTQSRALVENASPPTSKKKSRQQPPPASGHRSVLTLDRVVSLFDMRAKKYNLTSHSRINGGFWKELHNNEQIKLLVVPNSESNSTQATGFSCILPPSSWW